MIKHLKRKLTVGVIGALVSTAAVVAPMEIANASIPDSSGTIHSCYNNYTGLDRIIDNSTASCNADETALTWDQSASPTVYTVSENITEPGYIVTDTVSCDSGDKVVSGGLQGSEAYEPYEQYIYASWPSASGTWSWELQAANGGSTWTGTLYATCVKQ